MKRIIVFGFLFFAITACQTTSMEINATTAPILDSTPAEVQLPSYKVAAFYYPWYGNPAMDKTWIHWDQNNHLPPNDIASDYFPALGAYSSNDPGVIAQHMQWLQDAGIGIMISSWWGEGSREDQAVPLLLKIAEQYGIKVAFHIEPYSGRTAESLVNDIKYIYAQFGGSPAFFRSSATSRYSTDNQPKGMFFVWSIHVQGAENQPVEAAYWQKAVDSIHALPDGGLIIADTVDGRWIAGGHFDGLYNYASLHLKKDGGFNWARSLPPDALYIPSVIPGFSAKRVGYAENTYAPRDDGTTFNEQWTSALGTGVEPAMVTITSFNEWHEGSAIEPSAPEVKNANGYTYANYGALPPNGYLELTRTWIEKYLAMPWPPVYRARIKVATTSDWTTLNIASGGAWLRPALVSASNAVANAGFETGDRFVLTQSINNANAGKQVEMIWDIMFTSLDTDHDLVLQIDRGNIGLTQITLYNYTGANPVEVKAFQWDGVTNGRNSHKITIPSNLLTASNP